MLHRMLNVSFERERKKKKEYFFGYFEDIRKGYIKSVPKLFNNISSLRIKLTNSFDDHCSSRRR